MEWIVMECVETADCELEVSAAFVGEDVLLPERRRKASSGMCGADGTESVSDRRWFCERDFFSFEFSGT